MIPTNFWVKKTEPQQYTLQPTKINSLKINFAANITYFGATALNLHRIVNKNQWFIKKCQ